MRICKKISTVSYTRSSANTSAHTQACVCLSRDLLVAFLVPLLFVFSMLSNQNDIRKNKDDGGKDGVAATASTVSAAAIDDN